MAQPELKRQKFSTSISGFNPVNIENPVNTENSVTANYYDGHSSRRQAVTLGIARGLLEIKGEELLRMIPLSDVSISAKLGKTPRLLHFVDGGHCEVSNHTEFEVLLNNAGMQPKGLLSKLESNWRYTVAATLFTIFFVVATFYWGLPWVAAIAAERIPASIALKIDEHFLEAVDDGLMQPSKLSDKRQQSLIKRFDNLRSKNSAVAHELVFRSSETIGANAFALPGGTILVTDQLVALAGNDEEIFAVLAHELGHVHERHPLRQLLQSSVTGLAMTWYLGDISTLLAAAPTLLLETRYSRNFERRADNYAAAMLRMNGIAPSRLADILEKLEYSHAGIKADKKEKSSSVTEFISSHPDTDERIRVLRGKD